jgi:hypothetical protein
VNADQIEEICYWLNSLGVRYVVVGGSAIERTIPVGTGDVDVLIAVEDWGAIDSALERRRDASPMEPFGGSIRATRLRLGTELVDIEFISGQPFCGNRLPDEFIEYVRSYRCKMIRRVRYATAPVVWYMRLSINDQWQQYVWKIVRDVRAGVPESTFDGVASIAKHFGVGAVMRARIRSARSTLDLSRGSESTSKVRVRR